MRRLALVAGRERGQPVALVPVGAAAEMGQLDHHRAAVLMALVGELPHPADHFVLVGQTLLNTGGLSLETAAEPAVMVMAMPARARST
jgi:hypothetical protein